MALPKFFPSGPAALGMSMAKFSKLYVINAYLPVKRSESSDTSWDHWFVEDTEPPIFFSFMMKLRNADIKGFESVTSARLHLMKNKE